MNHGNGACARARNAPHIGHSSARAQIPIAAFHRRKPHRYAGHSSSAPLLRLLAVLIDVWILTLSDWISRSARGYRRRLLPSRFARAKNADKMIEVACQHLFVGPLLQFIQMPVQSGEHAKEQFGHQPRRGWDDAFLRTQFANIAFKDIEHPFYPQSLHFLGDSAGTAPAFPDEVAE